MFFSRRAFFVPFLLFLFALFFRTILLNRVPASLTNDEFDYIIAGQSIFFTGKTLPHSPALGLFSWSQDKTASGVVIAELPVFIIAPFVGLFPDSMFAARLPYALLSALTAVVLYFLTRKIFQNEKAAILAAVVFALNPWSIYFGRTSFEFTFAVFFYLAGLTVLVSTKKLDYLVGGVALLLCGFLSYHGMKILFLPLLFITVVYRWPTLSQPLKKQFSVIVTICVVLFLGYLGTLKYQSTGGRVSELLGSDTSKIEKTVTEARRLSIPALQHKLIYNKPTQLVRTAVESYFKAFSVQMLFLNGDGIPAYSLWEHGYFYYVDFFLIIVGMIGSYWYSRRAFLALLAVVLISPLPSVINQNTQSYAIRSGMLFPILVIFVAVGIYFIVEQLPKKFRLPAGVGIAGIYLISVLQLLNLYFFRLPVYNSEAFYLSQKIMAQYIHLNEEESAAPILVSLNEPQSQFLKYLFYSGAYNQETAAEITRKITDKDYSWKNVTFLDGCLPAVEATASGRVWLYTTAVNCQTTHQLTTLRISSPADSGTIINIYNDQMCQPLSKHRYPVITSFRDLDVQSMQKEELCATWISRYFDSSP